MEDEKIINLYWERSEIAIDETAKKYGRYLKTIARNVLINERDAEECVNDAYLGAWNAIPPGRPSPLRVFLGRITRNIALDRYDYNHRKKRKSEFDIMYSELEDCLPDRSAEQQFEKGIFAATLNEFLAGLPADKRKLFVRRYWYFDSVKELAANFGMKEAAVKTTLYRLRNALRDYLESEGYLI